MTSLTSQLSELLSGRTVATDQTVLGLLADAEAADLNETLTELSGPELFRTPTRDQQAALMLLLGRERRDELEPHALAHVVHGLQSVRRTALRDELLVELLISRRGTELTRVKNRINTAEDHQDLEDLLFVDLPQNARSRILEHFAVEAETTSVSDVKILSDIDDTVFCKLHDRRWPRRLIYPGVLAMFDALDLGPDDEPFDRGDVTFVTARPADAWGLVENHSRTALRRAGVSKLSVLSGSLLALLSKEKIAEYKMRNIDHYRQLFGEYGLMFLGDSGQADVLVAEHLVNRHPEAIRLVLIHDVAGTGPTERELLSQRGIHFHDTYIGAALIAYEHHLISRISLERVAREAVGGFAHVRWDSTAQRSRMRDLFERDLAAVEAVLNEPSDLN